MIPLFKMAFRDLERNRRRSFFSALALGMGLALLLLMAAVVTGEMRGAMEASIHLQSGHLQVRAKSYDETKTSLEWKDLIENPQQIAAQIATLAPVVAATPRLFASGIISDGDRSLGVRITGIDPNSAANDPFRQGVVSGEFLSTEDNSGILIGQPLAEKLHLKTGDQVKLLVNTSDGTVDQQSFTVRGIYTTHTPGYDQSVIFMPLTKAQAITRTEKHASIIFVLLQQREQTGAVLAALQAGNLEIRTWQQMNTLLLDTEEMSNAYMVVLYLIVLVITATVIVNTLVMSVFERTREIGILSAIGMKASHILAMFFAESGLLALGGIVMGLVLGGLLVAYATKFGFYIGNIGTTGILLGERIYAYLNPSDAVNLTLVSFGITLLAALYPALLAARMEPVDALRSGE